MYYTTVLTCARLSTKIEAGKADVPMEIKLAFFDVDGTLSVPRYRNNGQYVIGFSEEDWVTHCVTSGENAYDDCLPVAPARRHAEALKQAGARLFVLTTSMSEAETAAKKKFIRENFPGLFEEVIAVPSDAEKAGEIRRRAEEAGVSLSACELVEDTYATLLAVLPLGIRGTHISRLVWDL